MLNNVFAEYMLLAAVAKAAIAPPPSLMDLDVKPTEDFQGKLAPSIVFILCNHFDGLRLFYIALEFNSYVIIKHL